jgi:hypothetical protein
MEVQAAVQEAPATEVPVVVTEEARQIVVKGQTKEQNRAEFLARYNKEKENAKSTVAVAETGADQSETVAQEQSTSTTESEAAEPDQGAGTTEQAVDEELAAAKALNDIARQGRIFKERQRAFAEKMSAQEKRLAEREARAAEIAKREEELTAAAKSGKKTAVIRRAMQAAGVPDSEIANFLTEALMEAADDEPPATPRRQQCRRLKNSRRRSKRICSRNRKPRSFDSRNRLMPKRSSSKRCISDRSSRNCQRT